MRAKLSKENNSCNTSSTLLRIIHVWLNSSKFKHHAHNNDLPSLLSPASRASWQHVISPINSVYNASPAFCTRRRVCR